MKKTVIELKSKEKCIQWGMLRKDKAVKKENEKRDILSYLEY